MIRITTKGSFRNTEQFLNRMKRGTHFKGLDRFGPIGVAALSQATPKDSSETANSWTYDVIERRGYYSIVWSNTHVDDGVPIAVILQYGHGTGTGGYVEGRDYINPAMRPIFDQMVEDMWKEVTR